MPEQIIEDNWPLGWIPSSSLQADFGAASQGLLRMDNLSLDERGSLVLAPRPNPESLALGYQINSIFGAYIAGRKLRYLYDTTGQLHRNYGTSASLTLYDLPLIFFATLGTTLKASFLNALGHVIIVAGAAQYKDRGDIQWPLQIPTPAPPLLQNLAAVVIDLSNLAGGNYTNWVSISSSAFSNGGTSITITPNLSTYIAAFQAVYSSLIDTTNFGVTGEDQASDPFTFQIQFSDPTQLNYIRLDFYCTDPTAGNVSDYFFFEFDYNMQNTQYSAVNNFPIATSVTVTMTRGQFQRFGFNSALGWNTIKGAKITVGCIKSSDPTVPATTITWSILKVGTGAVTGILQYLVVELNDTGQFVQHSVASTIVSINASLNFVKVDRSLFGVNTQCNQIRTYRNDAVLGQFIEVNRQSGVYGFTPAFFTDKISDQTLLANAAVNSDLIFNFYSTNLPTNIIGMIYFASRVIYLTTNSFIPSFQLDFGSYDSRFVYELTGTNTELALFITKLSVGTFIIATTVDFYQVTGTFALVSTTLADGTTVTVQDVNILPLGVSDPAINSSFFEVEGNIFYMSARGLRSMSNGVSTLLTTTTDLLFRNQSRYGFPAASLLPNDLSLMGMVSSGTRLYLALPFANGSNSVLVSTYNPPLPEQLRGGNYWRSLLIAALCLYKEQDGTVIGGDNLGHVFSLENNLVLSNSLYFLTQFNYGQKPTSTKTIGTVDMYIDTGGATLVIAISGIREDGAIVTYNGTVNTNLLQVVKFDPNSVLGNCLGFQTSITGTTTRFELGYIVYIIIQDYPPTTYYMIEPYTNLDRDTFKQLSKWGFLVDLLGRDTATATLSGDGTQFTTSLVHSPQGIGTQYAINYANLECTDWQLEIRAPDGMHFFKLLPPTILLEYPTITYYAKVNYTNLEKITAKQLNKWGFLVDDLGNGVTAIVMADDVNLGTQALASSEPQGPTTLFWKNFNHVIALDWQIEVFAPSGMRFYKFLPPDLVYDYPTISYYQIVPFSNLGKDTLKKLSKWGFVVDTLASPITVTVTADNKVVSSAIDNSAEPQGISTEFWYNTEDLAALDWQIELFAPSGMRFYKFMQPDVLQVYPPGRLLDQWGPLDLDRQGIAFAMRVRMINEGPTFHYEIFDNDVQVYANDLTTVIGDDGTYEDTFPKGINTSVFRLLISSPTVFYRFSVEVKVRSTGKETEERWVKL